MDFNNADWVIVGLVALSGLISVVRGFVKEALSLVIWVAALVVASNFKDVAAGWLVENGQPQPLERFGQLYSGFEWNRVFQV